MRLIVQLNDRDALLCKSCLDLLNTVKACEEELNSTLPQIHFKLNSLNVIPVFPPMVPPVAPPVVPPVTAPVVPPVVPTPNTPLGCSSGRRKRLRLDTDSVCMYSN